VQIAELKRDQERKDILILAQRQETQLATSLLQAEKEAARKQIESAKQEADRLRRQLAGVQAQQESCREKEQATVGGAGGGTSPRRSNNHYSLRLSS